MLTIAPTDLPGNTHTVSDGNPVRVTRALKYRLSWADIIEHTDPAFADLAGYFPEEHRPSDTFGAAGLESQEHAIIWIGPADVIARFRDDPEHWAPWTAIQEQGVRGEWWPSTAAWVNRIPAITWNPTGQGIVTEHDFDGAKVVVYELLGQPALLSQGITSTPDGLVPVVTYHCTRCHEAGTHSDRFMSASPGDRRAAGLRARKHMRPGQCRGAEATAWADQMHAAVRQAMHGAPVGNPAGLAAAHCQVSAPLPGCIPDSTCAEVREARTHAARHSQP